MEPPQQLGSRHTVWPVAAPKSQSPQLLVPGAAVPLQLLTPGPTLAPVTGTTDTQTPVTHGPGSSCWHLGLLTLDKQGLLPVVWLQLLHSGTTIPLTTTPPKRSPSQGKYVERDLQSRQDRLCRAQSDQHNDWPTIYMQLALSISLSIYFPMVTPLQIT